MNNDLFKAGISRRSFLTGAGALGVLAGLGLTGLRRLQFCERQRRG